jgi:hypothetical protein
MDATLSSNVFVLGEYDGNRNRAKGDTTMKTMRAQWSIAALCRSLSSVSAVDVHDCYYSCGYHRHQAKNHNEKMEN